MKKVTIEIENVSKDYTPAFQLEVDENLNVKLIKNRFCEEADRDTDYIFEDGDELIRVQGTID